MKIAISDCLLGTNCRYDGGNKKSGFIVDELLKYFEHISFCPEDLAFGTPRESIKLLKNGDKIDIIGNKTKNIYTDKLKEISSNYVDDFKNDEIIGFIFKSKSPTCGLERVKVYLLNGYNSDDKSSGIFASAIKDNFSLLPMEEEGRLEDSWLRENFIMQLFAFKSFEELKKSIKSFGELVAFHSSYKYLILSKSNEDYKKLGNIVANHQKLDLDEVMKKYEISFKKSIAKKNSIGKTINVLEHIYGFMKNQLDEDEKRELFNSFKDFKNRVVPLIVPISFLNLYVQKYGIDFIKNQVFLNPYPKELALRSNIESYK